MLDQANTDPGAHQEGDVPAEDTLFIPQAKEDQAEDTQMVNKDDQFMKDFLNEQIDDTELCGDDDLLTGLIDEEEELQFDRAENAPAADDLMHEERQIGS